MEPLLSTIEPLVQIKSESSEFFESENSDKPQSASVVCSTIEKDGTQKRRYICKECNKSFGHKTDLRRHHLVHSGERPHPCKLCGKKFARRTNLKKHIGIHSGEKPFKCTKCAKSFPRKATLERHLLTHSGRKEFLCSECPQRFSRKDKLTRHQFLHADPEERPSFPCLVCEKSFTRNSTLTKHLLLHSGQLPYHCPNCPKSFAIKWELGRHLITHSPIKPFSCDFCSMGFKKKDKLARHMKRHNSEASVKGKRKKQMKLDEFLQNTSDDECEEQLNSEMDTSEPINIKVQSTSELRIFESHSVEQNTEVLDDYKISFIKQEADDSEEPRLDGNWTDTGVQKWTIESNSYKLTTIKQELIDEDDRNSEIVQREVGSSEDEILIKNRIHQHHGGKGDQPQTPVTLGQARSSLHVLRSYVLRLQNNADVFSALITIENALNNCIDDRSSDKHLISS